MMNININIKKTLMNMITGAEISMSSVASCFAAELADLIENSAHRKRPTSFKLWSFGTFATRRLLIMIQWIQADELDIWEF